MQPAEFSKRPRLVLLSASREEESSATKAAFLKFLFPQIGSDTREQHRSDGTDSTRLHPDPKVLDHLGHIKVRLKRIRKNKAKFGKFDQILLPTFCLDSSSVCKKGHKKRCFYLISNWSTFRVDRARIKPSGPCSTKRVCTCSINVASKDHVGLAKRQFIHLTFFLDA